MAPTHISSTAHFSTLLSSNIYLIVDFYADWCGPCKTIAPIFEQLASIHTAAGKVAFCKVDVDAHQDIARKYGVSAMPTFLIFKNSSVSNTIRGANPPALKSAVEAAAKDAKSGPARQSAAFSSKGHTLGSAGSGAPGGSTSGGQSAASRGANALLTGTGFADPMVRFVALYFTSLFSLDAYAAARDSPFSVRTGR